MSSTPKLYLEKRKDKEGNPIIKDCLIRMYITIPDGRVEYSTGIRVDEKHFVADYLKKGKDPISVKAPNFGENNDRLSALTTEASRLRNLIAASKIPMSVKEFKENLDLVHRPKRSEVVKDDTTFIDYLELLISQRKSGEKTKPKDGGMYSKANIRKLKSLLSSLERYLKYIKKKDLKFEDINDAFYDRYKKFCYEVQEMQISTFGGVIKDIKAVMEEARKDKFNLDKHYSENKFVSPSYESHAVALTLDQLDIIYKLKIDDTILDQVRDMFLIGCYTALRFSDLSNLTIDKLEDNVIRLTQVKTGSRVTIPVSKKIHPILEKYGNSFPTLKIKLHDYNVAVREIMKIAKFNSMIETSDSKKGTIKKYEVELFTKISSHTARRTYATIMFKLRVPTLLIMAVTGHKTEASFLKYIRATNEDKAFMMAEEMERLGL
ncbi:Phage integrase family protein [compost metagenome]|uniref:tyrosine-type recombinase/integrase n=1 Tax=Sphingobacterium sp. 2149 TaxID=2817763 RepID=UPI000F9C05D8|nr:tyrosine-type recombinase/integrase [Sphingobacterium sp. 2149]MDR6734231.1 integrase [Sphingobacterium sp. 2149]